MFITPLDLNVIRSKVFLKHINFAILSQYEQCIYVTSLLKKRFRIKKHIHNKKQSIVKYKNVELLMVEIIHWFFNILKKINHKLLSN